MHHMDLFFSTSSRSLVVHTALMAIDVFCLCVHLPLIWHLEAPEEGETPLGVAVDGTLGGSRPHHHWIEKMMDFLPFPPSSCPVLYRFVETTGNCSRCHKMRKLDNTMYDN